METFLDYATLASLLLAVAFGGVVGFEREKIHKPAGLRTHMLVCLGSCLYTIISTNFSIAPAQIAAGIVAGIGFIGAGTIWAEKDKVQGVTTAASLWATAAVGLTVGIGDYALAAVTTLLVFIILISRKLFIKLGIEH